MHDDAVQLGALARRQCNVVTWEQLCRAGLGRGAVTRRLQEGTLQRLYRGVYLLGNGAPSFAASARAAVMVCRGAVVSHTSAAAIWRMLEESTPIHVTVLGHTAESRDGICVHRTRHLDRSEVRQLRGIPVTSPARTICDLATVEPARLVERALNEGRVRGLVSEAELQRVLARLPPRRGTTLVKDLLREPTNVRNDAERRLLQLIRQANLPKPLTNVRVHGYEVDVLWSEQRLIVEFDGFAAHGHRQAFERDRRRDRALIAAGYRVIRVTWRQLVDEPFAVIADLSMALVAAA